MSSSSPKVLACNRCKTKKLRCSRDVPSCMRCRNNDAECIYGSRQPRKRQLKKNRLALQDILQRLDYLERNAQSISDAPAWPPLLSAPASASASPSVTPGSDNRIEPQTQAPNLKAPSALLENLVRAAKRSTLNVLSTSDSSQITPVDSRMLAPLEEVLASLRESRALSQQPALSVEDLNIPNDTARLWIQDCFDLFSKEYFIGLADRKTVLLMPDIIDSPYITVNCSLQIVYYHALFQGWRVQNQTPPTVSEDCGRLLYRKCLAVIPNWERDQKTTFMDLIATSTMHFDYQLAFEFFEAATILIRELGLHRLGDPECSAVHPELAPYIDQVGIQRLRRGFWQMFHFEIFFRLYHDRPALITKDRFYVDLPGNIAQDIELDEDHLGAVTFMLTSRICFITKDYLDMLDVTSPGDRIRQAAVPAFCDRIEAYLSDWNVDTLIQNANGDLYRIWAFADPLINGLTTIILMERNLTHTSEQGAVPPVSNRAAAAACRIIGALFLLSNQKHHKHLSTVNLFSFYSFVAFFTVFHDLLYRCHSQAEDRLDGVDDLIKVLSQAVELLAALADVYDRFSPVLKAVEGLVSISRQLLNVRQAASAPPTTHDRSRVLPPIQCDNPFPNSASASYFDQHHQPPSDLSDLSDLSGLFRYANAIKTDLFGADRGVEGRDVGGVRQRSDGQLVRQENDVTKNQTNIGMIKTIQTKAM